MTSPRLRWQKLPASQLLSDTPLRAQWDVLNASRSGLPFLTSYAVAAALRVFGTGGERLFIGHSGAQPVAMFVLQRCGFARWQTFQPSQLPLGVWVAEPDQSLRTMAQDLLHHALGAALVFSVTQIDPLVAPREDDGPSWTSTDYVETGWIDIEGSFDDYWAQRGKNLRSGMRKQRNKLAAEGLTTQMRLLDSPTDMAPALARYGKLESAGWKAGNGTAIHPGNDQGKFYTELLEAAAAQGEAAVYEYYFGESHVASNLCLCRNGRLIVLKTTYDETVDKSLSPGFLLQQDEMEMFFGRKMFHRLEYFGRFMEWHSRWTEKKRTLHHLTSYRRAWLKQFAQRRRQAEPLELQH